MRIRGTRGGAEAGNRGCFGALAMRQGLLPLVPDAVLPNGQLAIFLQPRAALALDGAVPLRLQLGGFASSLLLDNHAQHVEIVHLTQYVLEMLQICAPRLVLLWQQTLHGVAEFLQSNAKP